MWMVTRRETETIVIKTKKEQIWIRYEIPAQFPVKWKERSFFARCPGGCEFLPPIKMDLVADPGFH